MHFGIFLCHVVGVVSTKVIVTYKVFFVVSIIIYKSSNERNKCATCIIRLSSHRLLYARNFFFEKLVKKYDFANSTAPLVFVCANETAAENGETRDDDTTLHFNYAFLYPMQGEDHMPQLCTKSLNILTFRKQIRVL